MGAILNTTFPIYGAIAIGFAMVRFGAARGSDMQALGGFVMNVALPALLFVSLASRDFSQIFHPGYVLAMCLGGLATMALVFLWFTLTGVDPARRALAVMGCTCPNSAQIGYPILLLALPDIAGVVLALNFLVESLILIPLCLFLVDAARGAPETGPLHRIAAILLGLLRRPMIIALLAGLAVSLSGVALPDAIQRLATMLGSSAAAVSLIAIGGGLVGLPMRGNRALAAQIAAGKLLLHPAIVTLAAVVLSLLGLTTLSGDFFTAAVLSAAMPMFGIYVMLAQEQGLGGAASIAMLTATTGGFFTLSVLLGLLT